MSTEKADMLTRPPVPRNNDDDETEFADYRNIQSPEMPRMTQQRVISEVPDGGI